MSVAARPLYELARGVGFPHEQARIMAAIALGESGGNPLAVGDEHLTSSTWGPSIGLWQIRSLHAHRGTGKERDATRLTDPQHNARSARIIFGQQGFRAWTVYNTGAYGKHLSTVDRAITPGADAGGNRPGLDGVRDRGGDVVETVGAGVESAAGGMLSGLDAVGSFFGALGQRGTWVRVLQVTGGTGLVVAGLALLGKDVAGAAVKTASDAVPVARAAKAAGDVAKAAGKSSSAAAAKSTVKAAGRGALKASSKTAKAAR